MMSVREKGNSKGEERLSLPSISLKFGATDRLPTGEGDCLISYSLKTFSAHQRFIEGQCHLGRQKCPSPQVSAHKQAREEAALPSPRP